ncbi:MAG: uroporphyrinogen-III synthase [Devosia sp.]|nr:uroporphyrinogen-III synthase [Devosia sp.]
MKMLVTRPEPDAQSSVARLGALGIEAVAAPLMVRRTLSFSAPPAAGFSAVAVTSTNALRALAEREALAAFLHLPLFAVGDRTAHEARQLGFTEVYAAGGTLDTLVTAIARARVEGPIFYAAGKHLSGDLAHALAAHGLMVVTTTVYDMVAQPDLSSEVLGQIEAGAFDAVLVYSQRTAEIFCAATTSLSPDARKNLAFICLSEKVAQPLIGARFNRLYLSDHPSEEAMMSLALAFAREQTGS